MSDDTPTLEEILEDPGSLESLIIFCGSVGDPNPVLFWKEVQAYKQITNERTRQEVAHEIFKNFVAAGSEKEISLDPHVKRALKVPIASNRSTDETFDVAQTKQLAKIATDIFPFYLRSEAFKHRKSAKNLLAIQDDDPNVQLLENVFKDGGTAFDILYRFLANCGEGEESHSVQMMSFWRDAEIYGSTGDSDDRQTTAHCIYAVYLGIGSPLRISFPEEIVENFKTESVPPLEKDIFVPAQKWVIAELSNVLVSKFKPSDQWETFKGAVDKIKVKSGTGFGRLGHSSSTDTGATTSSSAGGGGGGKGMFSRMFGGKNEEEDSGGPAAGVERASGASVASSRASAGVRSSAAERDEVLMQGYLVKKSEGYAVSWKRRWFTLRAQSLSYSLDELTDTAKNTIPLTDVQELVEGISTKRFSFGVQTPQRIFVFQANSRQDLERWLSALAAALGGLHGADWVEGRLTGTEWAKMFSW